MGAGRVAPCTVDVVNRSNTDTNQGLHAATRAIYRGKHPETRDDRSRRLPPSEDGGEQERGPHVDDRLEPCQNAVSCSNLLRGAGLGSYRKSDCSRPDPHPHDDCIDDEPREEQPPVLAQKSLQVSSPIHPRSRSDGRPSRGMRSSRLRSLRRSLRGRLGVMNGLAVVCRSFSIHADSGTAAVIRASKSHPLARASDSAVIPPRRSACQRRRRSAPATR
jgi:hypothetical protein